MINTVAADASRDAPGQGPGPFPGAIPGQHRRGITSARPGGSGRKPGSALIAAAAALLFVLGAGLFAVSRTRSPVRVPRQAPVGGELG